MSLKQSCFKSIVKCDLKRSWWISALSALFIFMSSTSSLFNAYNSYNYTLDGTVHHYSRYNSSLDFAESMFGNNIIGMISSIFVVLYLFSYLNKVNSVSFFHSLPATRSTLFFAHLTSGALLVILPMLINSIISLFALNSGVKASWIFTNLLLYILYSLVVFSLTLAVSMLTGSSVAGGVFTVVVIFLPVFVLSFASQLCIDYLYGYSASEALYRTLGDYVYLYADKLMSLKALIYIFLTLALFAFSFFIYKKRHLENHGEVIAFPNLKGLFKVLFAFCCAILGYYYFELFWGITSILTMLVFGTIGAVISNMLANKSLSIKGALRPILITTVAVLLLFVIFFFDIFGYEKRIPDIDDVKYANIGGLYYNEYSYVESEINGEGRIKVERKYPRQMKFESKEEIQLFLDLHKYAIDHQSENDDWNDDLFTSPYVITRRDSIKIDYVLKDGSSMSRYYRLPANELEKYTSKIYSTDTYREWKYPVLNTPEAEYEYVEISDIRTYYSDESLRISYMRDDAKKIVEALKLDRKNISYERMTANDYGSVINITLYYSIPYVAPDGREYPISQAESYSISKYDTNTWALLQELDLFSDNQKIQEQNILSVDIYADGYLYADLEESSMDVDISYHPKTEAVEIKQYIGGNGDYHRNFMDKEDVEVLFDLFMNYHNDSLSRNEDCVVFRICLNLDNNQFKDRHIMMPVNELPEILLFIRDYHLK